MSRLDGQAKVLNFVNRYRGRDGSYHYIEWRSHPYGKLIYAAARDITERIENEKRIKEISIRDPLTDIYNRRHIFERLEGLISEVARNGKIFSVSILDIDFFKKINDEYGHLAGDFIIKEFAAIINRNLRPYDLFGRYGGEEFIIVSLNSAREQTCTVVDRILKIIRETVFDYNGIKISFTFSAGIADSTEYERSRLSSEVIIENADNRLYMAKESGRNRIVISDLSIAD
jgi:diguanylate cyclase (GGDEF)-like protein